MTTRSIELHEKKKNFLKTLQEKLPNLPLLYWEKNKERKFVSSCDDIPDILGLHYNNHYWQVKQTKTNPIYLYAAYFDNRLEMFEIFLTEI